MADSTATPQFKAEQERQAQELGNAIQAVINSYGTQLKENGRYPMMNALAGALVAVTGGMLASVEDPRHRKALRNEMERALPRAIAQVKGKVGKAEVMLIGGFLQ